RPSGRRGSARARTADAPMSFVSIRFFTFLAAILGATAIPMSHRRKKLVLCAGSSLFYAAWDYRYLALLLIISVIDFWCAARIAARDEIHERRRWLAVSVISNLAILGYFKYAHFFVDNLNV